MNTFPNPLSINFGDGKIIICKWNGKNDRGIVLRPSSEARPVGSDCGLPNEPDHTPEKDEIFLHFKNRESLIVLRDILSEVVSEWEEPAQ